MDQKGQVSSYNPFCLFFSLCVSLFWQQSWSLALRTDFSPQSEPEKEIAIMGPHNETRLAVLNREP